MTEAAMLDVGEFDLRGDNVFVANAALTDFLGLLQTWSQFSSFTNGSPFFTGEFFTFSKPLFTGDLFVFGISL
jgi:hypothetical protein